jgi:hypothetical protein
MIPRGPSLPRPKGIEIIDAVFVVSIRTDKWLANSNRRSLKNPLISCVRLRLTAAFMASVAASSSRRFAEMLSSIVSIRLRISRLAVPGRQRKSHPSLRASL